MPRLHRYRGFVSHAWNYSYEYFRLVNLLSSVPLFDWHNYSVPAHDPVWGRTTAALEAALRRQIAPTNHVIIIAGMYANYRKWIERETTLALDMNKPIIGVIPWGAQRVPSYVGEVAHEMVGWNTRSIVEAIRRQVRSW